MLMSLRKSLKRNLRTQSSAEIPNLVRPTLEFDVVSDSAFERDGFEFVASGRFVAGARVSAFAVLNQFGRALECAHLTDACHIPSVPLDTEFEILIRIESSCVDGKLCHSGSLLNFNLSRDLADSDNHEFSRFKRAKPTRIFTIPRLMSFCVVVSLSHLTKYASRGVWPWNAPWRNRGLHERSDIQTNLRPEWFIVRLKDCELLSRGTNSLQERAQSVAPEGTSTPKPVRQRHQECVPPMRSCR